MDALVLAGGELERDRFPEVPAAISRKVLLPILGEPMVSWTVRALRACPAIGRIVVVGDAATGAAVAPLGAEPVTEVGGIEGNLRAGLEALARAPAPAPRVLALSGDLPLLSQAAVEDLLVHAPDVDVVFPVVERQHIELEYPNREWIFARTVEGRFTGSSAALFRPSVVQEQWRWVEALLGARRRSPLGLALLFGPTLALRLLLGRLRIADVEGRIETLLHLTARAYPTPFADLAMDVDKQSDLPLVEQVLRLRGLTGR